MRLILTLTIWLSLSAAAFSEDFTTTLGHASTSVVRVMVVRPNGGDPASVGTGFICRHDNDVVTAYHLLVGAERVLVRLADSNVPVEATILKVYKNSDIALLEIPLPSNKEPLVIGKTPKKGAQVLSLGHAYGANALESLTQMKIREIGGDTLDGILGDDNKRQIEELGYPDLGLSLLNLEAHPAPGFSGSPVLDTDGNVVGIIDGGIESGAGAVSWAIPASEIQELFQQPDFRGSHIPSGVQEKNRLLYGADLRKADGETISVNGFPLIRRRTRSLAEMQRTTEDPQGLNQILYMAGANGVDTGSMLFDIYEQPTTGACIVAPHDLKFTERGGVLSGSSQDGHFVLLVRLDNVHGENEASAAGNRFENFIRSSAPGANWQLDPTWCYNEARWRYDGAHVMRKAATAMVPMELSKYVFETIASKDTAFIGIASLNNELEPQGLTPGDRLAWIQMVLSVHLSQFAPGVGGAPPP